MSCYFVGKSMQKLSTLTYQNFDMEIIYFYYVTQYFIQTIHYELSKIHFHKF